MKLPAAKRLLLPAILLAGLTLFFASGASEVISWAFLGKHYAAIKTFADDHIWLGYLAFFAAMFWPLPFHCRLPACLPLLAVRFLAGLRLFWW